MPSVVTVTVLGRSHDIGCDEGQEDTVRARAAEVDRRASEVLRAVGQVDNARLMVMVALLLADELAEQKAAVSKLKEGEGPNDAALAAGLEAVTRRLAAIADSIERA